MEHRTLSVRHHLWVVFVFTQALPRNLKVKAFPFTHNWQVFLYTICIQFLGACLKTGQWPGQHPPQSSQHTVIKNVLWLWREVVLYARIKCISLINPTQTPSKSLTARTNPKGGAPVRNHTRFTRKEKPQEPPRRTQYPVRARRHLPQCPRPRHHRQYRPRAPRRRC